MEIGKIPNYTTTKSNFGCNSKPSKEKISEKDSNQLPAVVEISESARRLLRLEALERGFVCSSSFELPDEETIGRQKEAWRADLENWVDTRPLGERVISGLSFNLHDMLIEAGFSPKDNIANNIGVFLEAYQVAEISGVATVEERALMREIGLRMAQYFADNHMDENLGNRFMSEARRIVGIDIRREQGFLITNEEIFGLIPENKVFSEKPHIIDTYMGLMPPTGSILTNEMLFVMDMLGTKRDEKELILKILDAADRFRNHESGGLGQTNPTLFHAEIRRLENEANKLRSEFEQAAHDMGFGDRNVQIEWATRQNYEFIANAERIGAEIAAAMKDFDNRIDNEQFGVIRQLRDGLESAMALGPTNRR